MRGTLLIAFSILALGCAHQQSRNLAQRQAVTTPHGDFDDAPRGDRRERSLPQAEPPIVTPPPVP
jgi:hypothetical protein